MDETSDGINNGSTKTIAPIALDEIVIEGKRNEKECFTAIDTSTRNGLKELILLTKGTEKSCSKHFTLKVIKKADELSIRLIFVPANGTSIYQPLDRRIFGIVKSKLRSFAKSDIFSGPDRFKIITLKMNKHFFFFFFLKKKKKKK